MIHTILTNPTYTGDLAQGRSRVKSYKVHQIEAVPREEWVEAAGTLLLCTIALTMIRLIQRKYLLKKPPASKDMREWTYGLSGKRGQKAMQKWKVISMRAESYWFADVDDTDL